MATLARDLPTVDGFAIWNEPNLNTFWLYQYDAAGKDIAAPAYTSLLAHTYDALKAVSPKIKVYGGNLAPRGFEDADFAAADALADAVHPRHGHRLSSQRPDEADHGRLRAPPVPDTLRDPARAAAHGHVARIRRLRQARGAPRRGLRRHRAARLEAPDRVHRVRRPVADPTRASWARTRTSTRRSARTRFPSRPRPSTTSRRSSSPPASRT